MNALKNMGKSAIPQSKIWNKAFEYCEKNAVSVTETLEKENMTVIKGKVKCNFGFVHHPFLAVSPFDSQVVLSSACDCYESNEGNEICSHCAALFYQQNGNSMARIMKDPKIRLETLLEDAPQDFELSVVSDEPNPFGQREVIGKAKCNFGFIHRPILNLEGSEITSSYCDCYLYVNSVDTCPHCKALYSLACVKEDGDSSKKEDEEGEVFFEGEAFSIPTTEGAEDDVKSEDEIHFQVSPDLTTPMGEPDQTEEQTEDEGFAGDEEEFTRDEAEEVAGEADDVEPEPEEIPEEVDDVESEPEIPSHEPESMKIVFGTDEKTNEPVVWQPNNTNLLFHTNTGIIGTMGSGKTQFTKSVIAQLFSQREHNFTGRPIGILIFDYKGDYNENDQSFQEATKAKVLKPYHLPYNPFSLRRLKRKPQLPLHTASAFADILTKQFHLGPKQSIALIRCIMRAYNKCGITNDESTWDLEPPTFNTVYEAYAEDEELKKNDLLYAALERIYQYELFEPSSRKSKSLFDMIDGVVSIDLSGYDASMQSLIVAITLEVFYSQMQNAGASGKDNQYRELRKFIFVDEADTIMSEGFPALKKILKEGREFGVGVILSTQFLNHFAADDEDYSKYILTWVVHNVSDLKKSALEFLFRSAREDGDVSDLLPVIKSLECFHSVVKIGNQDVRFIKDKPFFEWVKENQQD